MQDVYLQILQFLGDSGYYARTESERMILQEIERKGYARVKRGTKNIFQLTPQGKNYLERDFHPNTKITDSEFTELLRKAYNKLKTPMKPLVRIPEVRQILSSQKIPDNLFNKKLLNLHDKGVITLHTAMSKTHALYGGIESDSGTGVYYYMMFEA
ncbi:MAG: hypothetical protein ACTSPG_07120 [Candidatus Hodarchaeales archaeon]